MDMLVCTLTWEAMIVAAFRKQRPIVKIGLWVLVAMIVVGLLGTTVAWYLDDARKIKPSENSSTASSAETEKKEDFLSLELTKQEELRKQYEGLRASDPDDLAVLTGSARVELRLGALYLQKDNKERDGGLPAGSGVLPAGAGTAGGPRPAPGVVQRLPVYEGL